MPGRISLGQYGNFTVPQAYTLAGASVPATVLGQWWFDFSTIAENNINIFIGVESRLVSLAGGTLFPLYGLFIQPDGDIPAANLFSIVVPKVQMTAKPVGSNLAFHGYNGTAAIVNPKAGRQILFAVDPDSTGTSNLNPTNYQWRSLIVDIKGV